MSTLNLYKTQTTANDGTPVRLVYDHEADILDIFFGENESATGIELTDQILLRLNKKTKRAISLMVLDFSILAEQTKYGPRSYPLDKLHDLPEDLASRSSVRKELVLKLMTSMPVSQFLKLCHFQASPTRRTPLTYIVSQPVKVAA